MFDYLAEEDRAVKYLAQSLHQGRLVLFLGAGVSSCAELPGWRVLIERMRSAVGLSNDGLEDSADDLERAADEVLSELKEDQRAFAELTSKCLYQNVRLNEDLLRDPLLIALGALMTGSRRGSVRRVVTLNFDSILEWYISLCGFVPQVVLQPPVDEGVEDVRIYHPHGFLPHPELEVAGSKFVILGSKSINLRLGKPDEWMHAMNSVMSSGLMLFVGLSIKTFRDRAIAPLLSVVHADMPRRKDQRPTGFWLLKRGEPLDESTKKEFLRYGVIPLAVAEERIPKFLLSICQSAAEKILVSA